MNKHEAEKLIAVIRELSTDAPGRSTPADAKAKLPPAETPLARSELAAVKVEGQSVKAFEDERMEAMYRAFKNRFIDEARIDPVLLHLLTVRPEIVVEVEPRRQTLEMGSLRGRIARLAVAGFFSSGREPSAIKKELIKTGPEPASNRLSEAVTSLVNDGFLIRDGNAFTLAPGVKITEHTLEA